MSLGGGGSLQASGITRGTLLKRRYVTVVGLYSVKMVADRHRHADDKLFRDVNTSDLEPPK